jgi:hypothetical protein
MLYTRDGQQLSALPTQDSARVRLLGVSEQAPASTGNVSAEDAGNGTQPVWVGLRPPATSAGLPSQRRLLEPLTVGLDIRLNCRVVEVRLPKKATGCATVVTQDGERQLCMWHDNSNWHLVAAAHCLLVLIASSCSLSVCTRSNRLIAPVPFRHCCTMS